jgi:two-component system NtrC family sensor kinase
MRNIARSLAFRLFCLLLLVSAVVFISLTFFIIRANRQHIMQEIVLSAKRTNELLLLSMRQGMLLNRLEDIAQTMHTLRNGPGVEDIRIYNKKGEVVFSTSSLEVGQSVDKQSEQCIMCHSGPQPLDHIPEALRLRFFNSPNGYRILRASKAIHNEPACSALACHPSLSEQKILGVLESDFTLAQADQNIVASRNLMILYSIGAIMIIELLAGVFIMRMVYRRVVKLAEGPREVEKGNLDFEIQVEGDDEIADLARSFNRMVATLKQVEAENARLSQQMVGVAKMASMGKLAASVAHEINNPLGGILVYAKIVSRRISGGNMTEEELKENLGYLETIISEIKRCGNIVKDLLHFSRSSKSVLGSVDVHSVIDRALSITNHHFEINGISKATRLEAKNPNIIGDANQIAQVLIALLMNAVEAMPRGGVLTVTTKDLLDEDVLRVSVSDNGMGISPEIRSSIFEPFFTTKESMQSSGLGLSVVYGIMLRHQGKIEVESEPGQGTTFILIFPRQLKPHHDTELTFDGFTDEMSGDRRLYGRAKSPP